VGVRVTLFAISTEYNTNIHSTIQCPRRIGTYFKIKRVLGVSGQSLPASKIVKILPASVENVFLWFVPVYACMDDVQRCNMVL